MTFEIKFKNIYIYIYIYIYLIRWILNDFY